MPAIAALTKVSMHSCRSGYRAVSKIQRVPVEGRSVRKTGRAPTGGEAELLHDRLIRLNESPVGAGHARDCLSV
jgi:hypothetical protein